MPRSMTRRTIVAAAARVTPLAGATRGAFAQPATPASSDVEAIVRSFYEPFSTGATSVYDTILAEDWVDHPLGPGQQPGREGFKPVIEMFRLRPGVLAFIRQLRPKESRSGPVPLHPALKKAARDTVSLRITRIPAAESIFV
jgi:hypothetical protein